MAGNRGRLGSRWSQLTSHGKLGGQSHHHNPAANGRAEPGHLLGGAQSPAIIMGWEFRCEAASALLFPEESALAERRAERTPTPLATARPADLVPLLARFAPGLRTPVSPTAPVFCYRKELLPLG